MRGRHRYRGGMIAELHPNLRLARALRMHQRAFHAGDSGIGHRQFRALRHILHAAVGPVCGDDQLARVTIGIQLDHRRLHFQPFHLRPGQPW